MLDLSRASQRFSLVPLGQPGTGAVTYQLDVSQLDDGRVQLDVVGITAGLSSGSFELSYPDDVLVLQEGAFGEWPKSPQDVVQSADLSQPGRVVYEASVNNGNSATGKFPMLTLVFRPTTAIAGFVSPPTASAGRTALQQDLGSHSLPAPRQQPNAPTLPTASPESKWLNDWYLTLPSLDSMYSVYGTAQAQNYADEIMELTNFQRQKKGHTLLKRSAYLDAVAQAHARHMAKEGFFDHPNPQGMEVFERLDAVNCPDWWTAGENIAAGYANSQEAVKGWMDSSGHRKNIRNEDYRYMGVGAFHAPGTQMGWYWVQVFATFKGDPDAQVWVLPMGQ